MVHLCKSSTCAPFVWITGAIFLTEGRSSATFEFVHHETNSNVAEERILYTLGQAAKQAGCSKATISRAIKKGNLSAKKNDDNTYSIDPAELQRWNDSNGHVNGSAKRNQTPNETPETLMGNSGLQAELEALRQIARDREKTIEDLRDRLDKADDERRQMTVRILEYERPRSFWARLRGR